MIEIKTHKRFIARCLWNRKAHKTSLLKWKMLLVLVYIYVFCKSLCLIDVCLVRWGLVSPALGVRRVWGPYLLNISKNWFPVYYRSFFNWQKYFDIANLLHFVSCQTSYVLSPSPAHLFHSHIRKKNAPKNMSVIRHIVLNLLRTTYKKTSL